MFWDLESGEAVKVLKGHQARVTAVDLGADNMYAVSGDTDGVLCLWDLTAGRRLQVLKGHLEGLSSVALAPDGLHVATAGYDRTLRYWNLAEAKLVWTCRDHPDVVQTVDISPDGHYIITGCRDHIYFWDLSTRTCTHRVQAHNSTVAAAAFSPSGQMALSAGQDRTISLWYLDQEPDIREIVRYDKGAMGYLKTFLVQQTPYGDQPPTPDRTPPMVAGGIPKFPGKALSSRLRVDRALWRGKRTERHGPKLDGRRSPRQEISPEKAE